MDAPTTLDTLVTDIIAVRHLYVTAPPRPVTVIIGRPTEDPEGLSWSCPYQILGIGTGKLRRGYGVDAVQALLLTLKMIGADLYTSEEAKRHALQWLDGLPNVLGFPVADAIKDILPEGEDS